VCRTNRKPWQRLSRPFIAELQKGGSPTSIVGGIGRTGLAVACWLQERGQTPDEALTDLADKWRSCAKSTRMPSSPETAEQVRWVKEWPVYRSTLNLQMTRERYRGALVGLATGDALGTTLEFKPPGTFAPLADMIGGGLLA
jgi:hypothetical protein